MPAGEEVTVPARSDESNEIRNVSAGLQLLGEQPKKKPEPSGKPKGPGDKTKPVEAPMKPAKSKVPAEKPTAPEPSAKPA